MEAQPPNYRGKFFKSPHHVALGFLTLGLGLAATSPVNLPLFGLSVLLGAAAYAIGWLHLPDSAMFRRWVDKGREDDARAADAAQLAEFVKRRDTLLAALSPGRRELYESLAAVCRDIERASADNPLSPGAGEPDPRLRKLDELMWTYLRLLGIEESLQRFVETERGENLPELLRSAQASAKACAADADKLQKDGETNESEAKKRLFASLTDRAEVLKKRVERCREASENLELVAAERDRLVQQVKLIRADAVATRNAEALTSRIDATVEHLGQTNKWLSELDQFKDIVGDLPAVSGRIGFEPSAPPPGPSAAEPVPDIETRRRERLRELRDRRK